MGHEPALTRRQQEVVGGQQGHLGVRETAERGRWGAPPSTVAHGVTDPATATMKGVGSSLTQGLCGEVQ